MSSCCFSTDVALGSEDTKDV
ncbi:hypothetical protein R3I94_009292 [Phoxinus phoxinus]|uniref:Uncharacterized protein n=1 Tax=Phoxinus phoxinus TaxID=58324 RepID=A0AAN9CGN6_9TELE